MHAVAASTNAGWRLVALAAVAGCLVPGLASGDDGGELLPELGAKLSLGATTFRASDDDRMVGVVARARAGYVLGLYAIPWRYRWLRLQTELLYSSRQVTLAETRGDMEVTYDLRYVELPILARADVPLRLPARPFFALGVSPGVLFGATHERGLDLSDVLNKVDLGLVGAVGATIVVSPAWNLTIEARGVYGLGDVFVRTSRTNRAAFLTLGVEYNRVPRHGADRDSLHRESPDMPPSLAARASSNVPDSDEARHAPVARASSNVPEPNEARHPEPAPPARGESSPDHEEPEVDDPEKLTGGFASVEHDDRLLRQVDGLFLAANMVGCFHRKPGYMKQVAGMPEDSILLTVAYTRYTEEPIATIHNIRVVSSRWNDPRLARCIEAALDGLRWHSGVPSSLPVREMQVDFSYWTIDMVIRELRPRYRT